MKVFPIHAILATAASLIPAAANAEVAHYRSIDLSLSEISVQARNLRWDIAAAPIREIDRRIWLRGMDDVCDEITDLQKSVLRGRTQAHLCREIDDLRDEVHDLHEDVVRRGTPADYRYERGINGARFRCGVLSNGCVIPSNFVSRLDALDQAAQALHNLVAGGASGIGPGFGDRGLPTQHHLQPPVPSSLGITPTTLIPQGFSIQQTPASSRGPVYRIRK